MTTKLIIAFISIFFIGCRGNTPSVKSQDDKIIEEAYDKMNRETNEATNLENRVENLNKKIDNLLEGMGTTK